MAPPREMTINMLIDGAEVASTTETAMPMAATTAKKPVSAAPVYQDSQPWVEKYRPKSLDELVSHKDIISTITRFVDQDRLPHLLFYGPPGTGKTSTILACARKIYGNKFKGMTLELNASDDRGIDVVRNQIKSFASTRMIFSSGYKLIILDEADAMTQVAQGALRRVIEKYTKNVRFCIICNYVSKIIPAVQSRCTRFRFMPLAEDQMRARLNDIADKENVNLTDGGRDALLKLADGDMRKVLNVLQAAHVAFDAVDKENVYACTGQPLPEDIETVVATMMNDSFSDALKNVAELKLRKGLAIADLVKETHAFSATLEMGPSHRAYLTKNLADIEYAVAAGTSEKLQLSALVALFQQVRGMIANGEN